MGHVVGENERERDRKRLVKWAGCFYQSPSKHKIIPHFIFRNFIKQSFEKLYLWFFYLFFVFVVCYSLFLFMMWRSPPICNTLCCCCWCRSSNVASLATLLSRLRHIIHYSELWHAPHTCRVITNRQLLGSANAFTLVRGCGCNGVRFDSDLTPRVSSVHELFSFLSSFFFFICLLLLCENSLRRTNAHRAKSYSNVEIQTFVRSLHQRCRYFHARISFPYSTESLQ